MKTEKKIKLLQLRLMYATSERERETIRKEIEKLKADDELIVVQYEDGSTQTMKKRTFMRGLSRPFKILS
jgi:hypothetical protein